MSQPTRETRILALAVLLLALLVNSPGRLSAAAASFEPRSEELDANPISLSFASGMVLAVSEAQIGLFQYHEAPTNCAVAIFSYDDTTVQSADASLAPGEDIVIEFLRLTEEQLFATRIQRLPAGEFTTTDPVGTEPRPAGEGPLEFSAGCVPEAEPTREDPQIESGAENADSDRFSFGRVVALTSQGLVVWEYDFAKDADVETSYQLLPHTESGNLSEERPLRIGDEVVLDYREETGQRFVTTLVREEVLETTEPTNPEDSGL